MVMEKAPPLYGVESYSTRVTPAFHSHFNPPRPESIDVRTWTTNKGHGVDLL